MKRAITALAFVALSLAGCGSNGPAASTRTIQVDYHTDDFAGTFRAFFPRKLTVPPGSTLNWQQSWSGEPHSIVFGKLIDEAVVPFKPLINQIIADPGTLPPQPPEAYRQKFEEELPFFFNTNGEVNQQAAEPCFLPAGASLPPKGVACPKPQRVAKPFTGTEPYYSSGFIPFEGLRSNSYQMKIADNAKPGTYFYYCSLHGTLMSGEITVAKGAKLESQASINRRGKLEFSALTRRLADNYKREKAGTGPIKGNLAGSGDPTTPPIVGVIDEFTPQTITTKVGDKVTWTFVGDHSISFNVPPYAPIYTVAKDGSVHANREVDQPRIWPGPGRIPFSGPPDLAQFQPKVHIDAGTYDGSGGLHSSGTGFETGDTYSITFTKPGAYPYACLIHPGMIGKVVVQ